MPLTLRGRAALFALLAVFLIPIGMSSLRGLTQVVTCAERVEAPFSLQIVDGAPPIVVTSNRIEADQESLCGGLLLDLRARAESPTDVTMIVIVTNPSDALWRGTVQLVIGGTSYPVPIGRIEPGETVRAEVVHHLRQGAYELSGSLLIGP